MRFNVHSPDRFLGFHPKHAAWDGALKVQWCVYLWRFTGE